MPPVFHVWELTSITSAGSRVQCDVFCGTGHITRPSLFVLHGVKGQPIFRESAKRGPGNEATYKQAIANVITNTHVHVYIQMYFWIQSVKACLDQC